MRRHDSDETMHAVDCARHFSDKLTYGRRRSGATHSTSLDLKLLPHLCISYLLLCLRKILPVGQSLNVLLGFYPGEKRKVNRLRASTCISRIAKRGRVFVIGLQAHVFRGAHVL